MKTIGQIVILALGLIAVFLFEIPLSFEYGTSAVQATQLYAGAQMWLLVLIVVGLAFIVGLVGQAVSAIEALNRSIRDWPAQAAMNEGGANHDNAKG